MTKPVKATKVAIFDDNKPRRELLKMLISSTKGFECTGAFEDCRNVLSNIATNIPDLVLMDIDMPHVNGIEGLTQIKSQFPQVKIMMQTIFEDDDKIFSAIKAGADGYILKKRGYKPEAFWKLAEHRGLSDVDKVMDSKDLFKILDEFNKP